MSDTRHAGRVLMTIAVMSTTVMQVLDTTILNVALPHMAGQLSATPDQISWVLTSYLVASAIAMPMTGYFTDRLGRRNYLLISIFGFMVTSGLCGTATNLAEIVSFRLLQGLFGASLIPLSQAILVQAFSIEERGRAMAIWGMGIMVGPILGPTLGGYLTDVLSWRWTFYINLPVGALSLLLAWRTVPDTPRQPRTLDWTGFGLMFLAVGGLQFLIDRGNQEDWFNSTTLQVVAIASAIGLVAFIYHSLSHVGRTLIDLRMFRDRSFTSSCLLLMVFAFGLFSAVVLQPLMLENLLGYPAATAGWIMAPRGVASLASMLVVGRLINRVPPRNLVLTGILVGTLGAFAMTRYDLQDSLWFLIWPSLLQGLAVGPVFVPLATLAYKTLPRAAVAEASGMYNLIRTLGTSIGISIVATVLTRQSQVAWSEVGSHIQPFNPTLGQYLANFGMDPSSPQAPAMLAHELARQSQMIGMVDAFTTLSWAYLMMIPLVFFLEGGRLHQAGGTPAAAAKTPAAAAK